MLRFPFTAIVGQEKLKNALLLNAINPSVGGVLIRGEKGTAKSTLARALADILPSIEVVPTCPYQCHPDQPFEDCPHCRPLLDEHALPRETRPRRVLTLPTNATEDRVCGTLNLEKALQTGGRHFEPGLLAEAHRGILYIDEVNLLDDHIVDALLDAAAMGVNIVEREGVRMLHPARFVLIGTMNPEEGDLRPQLLDRFGLCVNVEAIQKVDERAEIIKRRIMWQKDPVALAAQYTDQQRELANALKQAEKRLPTIELIDDQLHRIAELCVQLDVRSHRADIIIAQTAMTFAAMADRGQVADDDIQRAAELALPHRMRKKPFEQTELSSEDIQEAMAHQSQDPASQTPDSPCSDSAEHPPESDRQPDSPSQSQEKVFEIGDAVEMRLPHLENQRQRRRDTGKRSRSLSDDRRGRYVKARQPSRGNGSEKLSTSDVALDATLRAAAPWQKSRIATSVIEDQKQQTFLVKSEDVRVKVRERSVGTTILFVVDASGSMGASERMRAAKGATLSLLTDAYQQRDRVALIAFRNRGAEVLLSPTDSVDLAHAQLAELPTGGRTPLTHGLAKALDVAQQIRRKNPQTLFLTVLISDGKANVPYQADSDQTPFEESISLAQKIVDQGIDLLVLDTEDGFLTLGLAQELANATGADYVKLANIEAESVRQAVQIELHELSEK